MKLPLTVTELWLIAVPVEFVTVPAIVKFPSPAISFLFVPSPVYVIVPSFVTPSVAAILFTFVSKLAPSVIVTSLCFMFPSFTTSPLTSKLPSPVIVFTFVPPVNSISPAFVILFSVTILSAFITKLPSSVIAIVPCSILPLSSLFVTFPSIVNVPLPLITLLFSPPVNIKSPTFVIPVVVSILLAFVVKLAASTTVTVLC